MARGCDVEMYYGGLTLAGDGGRCSMTNQVPRGIFMKVGRQEFPFQDGLTQRLIETI